MITERTTGGRQALSKMISNITNGTWKPLVLKFSSAQYRTPEGQSDQNPKNPHRSKSHPKGNQLEPGRWVNDSKSKAKQNRAKQKQKQSKAAVGKGLAVSNSKRRFPFACCTGS